MSPQPIKLMLVDDHPIWRDSVRRVVERKRFAKVVALASDGDEAVKLARTTKPDVVLMDLHLPGLNGAEATAKILEQHANVKVLMLSASGDEEDVLSAVKAGARGYILKTGDSGEIVDAIRRVQKGEPVFTAALAGLVLGEFKRKGPSDTGLTQREREVLKLVSQGLCDHDIARRLSVAEADVRVEIRNCVAKLQGQPADGAPVQTKSRARAARKAERVVATVLFVDIVGSTEIAARIGDERWRQLLGDYYAVLRRQLSRHGGREIDTAGDGLLAIFDQPTAAVRCAGKVTEGVRKLGLEIRAGLHTGECEIMGENIGGIAVHIGARVMAKAKPGEVLVSGTIKDLMAGSGAKFLDRGMHVLKGVPQRWRLYAIGE